MISDCVLEIYCIGCVYQYCCHLSLLLLFLLFLLLFTEYCVYAQDAVELLEKRVKSRFSHRQINLFCDYSFEEYLALLQDLVSLPAEISDRGYRSAWERQLKVSFKIRSWLQYREGQLVGANQEEGGEGRIDCTRL